MRIAFVRAFVIGCGLLVTCDVAHANIIFTLGNNPSGDVNILLNSGATGTVIEGSPNGRPDLVVDFTSSQVLFSPSSGQARVAANPEGTPLTNLMIFMTHRDAYSDLIINPNLGGGGTCPACVAGDATITVQPVSSGGTLEAPATFTYALGNGNNYLTITTSGGEFIASTTISVPTGFNDLRQPRISGPFGIGIVPEIPVPDPDTVSLLGFGLTVLVCASGKLRRRSG